MPLSGLSKWSIENALRRIDRTDATSLLSLPEGLEASLATELEKGRVIACALMKVHEVFDIVGFSNDYNNIGARRDYQVLKRSGSNSRGEAWEAQLRVHTANALFFLSSPLVFPLPPLQK